jgi:ketosteroid isomerase-like protein
MSMSVLKGIITVGALLLASTSLNGQEPPPEPKTQIMQVIESLFDAMREADSATVRSLVHSDLTTMASSFRQRDGTPAVRFGDLEGFAASIGGAQPGDFDERLGEPEIVLHDNLATVFTPYAFHLKGQLSHCGVNVFLIARTGDEWKIVGLADTRRMDNCEEWLQ